MVIVRLYHYLVKVLHLQLATLCCFVARDTTVYASGRDLTNSAYIMGDPEISFIQLELPPSVAVQLDEEVIQPPTTAGGIFSVADIKANVTIANIDDQSVSFESLIPEFDQVMFMGDIKLNAYIQEGISVNQTPEQIDVGIAPLNELYISDIKLNTYISEN